ncbi:hypothetical protein CCYN49044_20019 [Capnocytophaga cynodegmi]|uniref:Uncharacterized protein n=1 Tax=Capnocytophaga cynodegmi TaxID=28189 RepID=A0A0B7HHD5_9FLAO|nr:hypothetical protein CCYN49044_20019 [Capnocytophaga cynodegmi]CEN40259.1 hypothetical protein CCYN74_40206 [Capnocytophaga cynodegmi]
MFAGQIYIKLYYPHNILHFFMFLSHISFSLSYHNTPLTKYL